MLQASDLTLHYGSSKILHGVSLTAEIGKITCVMGSNGVGKTSLIKNLCGCPPPKRWQLFTRWQGYGTEKSL